MLNKLVRLLSAKVKSVDLDLAFTAEELSPGIKNIHQSKCGVKIETYISETMKLRIRNSTQRLLLLMLKVSTF